jgi:hypothetical protein
VGIAVVGTGEAVGSGVGASRHLYELKLVVPETQFTNDVPNAPVLAHPLDAVESDPPSMYTSSPAASASLLLK